MSVEDDIAFLKRAPLMRLLGDGALRIIAIGTESQYLHPGDVLYRQNERADAAYVVQDGAFTLERIAGKTRTETIGPATVLADLALLIETHYAETAVASEPSTVIRIPRTLFKRMLEGYPEAARRLRDHIIDKSAQLADDILNVQYRLGEGER